MDTAVLFPGQGSQKVGMGLEHYKQSAHFQNVVNEADRILGYSISNIMFEGPEELLKQTEHTQPAIFIHSLALFGTLEITPDRAAGHSLGEFSAWAASGALSFEDALKLVRKRGQLMQNAGIQNPGTMAAIIGMEDDVVIDVCSRAQEKTNLEVSAANFNSPGQVVISGYEEAVDAAIDIAKENGCRLAKKLPVSGAFHTTLMEPALEGLKDSLQYVTITKPSFPIYSNYTAKATSEPDVLRTNLLEQLMNPVRWTETIQNMKTDGAQKFVEVGPGKVLQGLVKRTLKDVTIEGYE